jgi:hypothetical protein
MAPFIYWGASRQWHEMLLFMASYLVALSALTVQATSLVNGTAGGIRILLQPLSSI